MAEIEHPQSRGKRENSLSEEMTKAPFDFERYVRILEISPEDLHKKILDVGGGMANFAGEARKRGYSEIFSVDIKHPRDIYALDTEVDFGERKMTTADALRLPFPDGAFDMVISLYSMPHLLFFKARNKNKELFMERVESVLIEMLRVVKAGGEVRLGGVPTQDPQTKEYPWSGWEQIKLALESMRQNKDITISTEITTDNDLDFALIRLQKAA